VVGEKKGSFGLLQKVAEEKTTIRAVMIRGAREKRKRR